MPGGSRGPWPWPAPPHPCSASPSSPGLNRHGAWTTDSLPYPHLRLRPLERLPISKSSSPWSSPSPGQRVITPRLLPRPAPAGTPAQREASRATQGSHARNIPGGPSSSASKACAARLLKVPSFPLRFLRLDVGHLSLELLPKLPHRAPPVWASSPAFLLFLACFSTMLCKLKCHIKDFIRQAVLLPILLIFSSEF